MARGWKPSAAGRGWGLRVMRVAYALIRDLREGQLTLRAMSLVYTTILSLVPLLAIGFSILKGFGVHNQVEPVLLNLLASLDDKGVEISERIVGFVAGLLWNSAGWAFAWFVVGSAKYTAIYSTFATLISFLIWLYLGWLILLTGTSITYYVQYPARTLSSRENTTVSIGSRERLALLVMQLIVQHFYSGKPARNSAESSARLAAPPDALKEVLTALERTKLIVKTATEPEGFIPDKPPGTTATKSVLDAVRRDGTEEPRQESILMKTPAVEELMSAYASAVETALSGHTLKDLADTPGVGLREIFDAETASTTSAG